MYTFCHFVSLLFPFSCFISHIGVFFGAFLGPILLIILFNTCIFASVVVVVVKHTLARQKRKTAENKLDLPPKEACRLILSLSGIMSLLGLAWILSLFTAVGVNTNRNAAFALQWMFAFFNSLQGFFVFFFFVVLSADARNSWLALLCPCFKSAQTPTSKSSLRYTGKSSSAKGSILSSNQYSSLPLKSGGELSPKMAEVGHSVIDEKEGDRDSSPDLAAVETALNEKDVIEMQEVSEKPEQGLVEENLKGEEGTVVRFTLKRVSTRSKAHHIETAEVIFNDQPSDESDDDDIAIIS